MLQLNNLVIGYKNQPLTAPLSASFTAGRLLALVGRNGVGKSTLLRCICGLQPALSGDIVWGEASGEKPQQNLNQMTRREVAQCVAVVLTHRPNTGLLFVEDVVSMGRIPYTPILGRLSVADKQAVDQAFSQCGIEHMRRRVFSALSDGERSRVMIAKALAQTTPAILLDEPTAFLDYVAKDEIFSLLHDLAHEARKLIFVSTHDIATAQRFSDEMLELTSRGFQPFGK
ncbi:MAG: ABC transporter ATP-binding protein [Bacteroidaceae bacterium]|nr:ABC transporter ATP-binding protein [Bacteroidaceae bacterium]MBR7028622.1 ABC transporter ATP-binding protein [Bacteroidaceae bacterium]